MLERVQLNPKSGHETTETSVERDDRQPHWGEVRQGRDSRPLQLESSRLSGVACDACAAQYPACILLPSRFSCQWRPTNSNSCNNFWSRLISSEAHPLIPACLFSCRCWGCFRDRSGCNCVRAAWTTHWGVCNIQLSGSLGERRLCRGIGHV